MQCLPVTGHREYPAWRLQASLSPANAGIPPGDCRPPLAGHCGCPARDCRQEESKCEGDERWRRTAVREEEGRAQQVVASRREEQGRGREVGRRAANRGEEA
jgi:hypothetical protein